MDPLFDEKLVMIVTRRFQEFFFDSFSLEARKEALGPSVNEGLCFESCTAVDFRGDPAGRLFLGLDGYTKIKLLPRMAEAYREHFGRSLPGKEFLGDFLGRFSEALMEELVDAGFPVAGDPPLDLSHKMVPLDPAVYRQYIIIFFLRDRKEKSYLGRAYLVLALKKG